MPASDGTRTCRLTADQARLRISIARVLTPGSIVRSSPTLRQGSSSRVTTGCRGSRSPGSDLWNFAPRVGVVWDPQGEGRETLRMAYGRLYDLPHLQTYTGLAQMSPWGNSIALNNLPQGWDNPWAATPGGDPIPELLKGPSANSQFPLGGQLHGVSARLAGDGGRSVERQLPAADRSRLDGVGELHRQHDAARLDDEPDQSGGVQSRRDDEHHASPSRAESAEPRGRQVLRQHPGARRRRYVELQRAAAVCAAAPRQRLVAAGQLHHIPLHQRPVEQRARRRRRALRDSRRSRGGPGQVPEFAGPQSERVVGLPDPDGWSAR